MQKNFDRAKGGCFLESSSCDLRFSSLLIRSLGQI